MDMEKMAAERAARVPGAYTHEARRKPRGAAGAAAADDADGAAGGAGGLLAPGDALPGADGIASAASVEALLAAVPVGVPTGLPGALDGGEAALAMPLLGGGGEEEHTGGL
jgi:hypothetical protein